MKATSKEKKINDIIDAAEVEFLMNSYEGVSMDSVALRAGIAKATIYYYFSNKDAVLRAVHGRLYEPVRAMMYYATEQIDVPAAFHKLLPDYLRFWADHPRELQLHLLTMSRTAGNPEAWPYVNAHVAAWLNWYELMLRKGVKRKQLRPHDVRSRSVALYLAMEGGLVYAPMSMFLAPKKTAAKIEKALLADLVIEENAES